MKEIQLTTFTDGNTRYTVKPERVAALRAILSKPLKHKTLALSSTNLKRDYPAFYMGMSTADYVDQFNKQFNNIQHKIKHDCANYHHPARMLDAATPEALEEENPDYVPEAPKARKLTARVALAALIAACEEGDAEAVAQIIVRIKEAKVC
jgi:hypothetical protein